MDLKKALRVALIFEWITIIAYIFLTFTLESNLPIQLQDYLEWEANQELTTYELIALPFLVIALVIYLISSIGIFFFKLWAKKIYIFVSVFLVLSNIASSPTVEHSITYTIGNIQPICFGFILALLLFTNVYDAET